MHTKDLLDVQNVQGVAEQPDEVLVFVVRKLRPSTIQKKIEDPESPWEQRDFIKKGTEVTTGLFTKKPTKVVELGKVRLQADRKKYRPVPGGCEIQPSKKPWVGTAGVPVRFHTYTPYAGAKTLYLVDAWHAFKRLLNRLGLQTTTKMGLLTNAHVTQESVANPEKGFGIEQPMRGGEIGTVIHSIPIKPGVLNEYDCSLVELNVPYKPEILSVGPVNGHKEPTVGERVHKYGRTTEYTQGRLIARNAIIRIDYGNDGILTLKDLDVYTNMSDRGDSGSVIVSMADNKVVGHLFAGSTKATIAIPFSKIANKLKIEV